MRRKLPRNGKEAGRWTTTRRTERSTRAPSFSNRSRRIQTWARAQSVRAARARVFCADEGARASPRNFEAGNRANRLTDNCTQEEEKRELINQHSKEQNNEKTELHV